MKINFKALGSFATVVGGIIVSLAKHPELIASLPGKVGAGVVLGAAVVSAVTDALHTPADKPE